MRVWKRVKTAVRAAGLVFKYFDAYGIGETLVRKVVNGSRLTDGERKRLLTEVQTALQSGSVHYYYRNHVQEFMQKCADYENLKIYDAEYESGRWQCRECGRWPVSWK